MKLNKMAVYQSTAKYHKIKNGSILDLTFTTFLLILAFINNLLSVNWALWHYNFGTNRSIAWLRCW